MADPLTWKPGEGYDLHVVRGGPSSKPLAGTFNLPANNVLTTLKYTPQIGGAPALFGLSVNPLTGQVTASPPPPNTSQAVINNFLLAVSIEDSGGILYETEIRIHVHDSVKDIWLTPSTLAIHKDANECRFTVLAVFSDQSSGEI